MSRKPIAPWNFQVVKHQQCARPESQILSQKTVNSFQPCLWLLLMDHGASQVALVGPSYGAGRHKRLPREIPWRRAWQPTPVFLPGETNGQRRLAGYSPRDCKESGMTEATWHTCNRPWHYASLSPDKSLYTFFFKLSQWEDYCLVIGIKQ